MISVVKSTAIICPVLRLSGSRQRCLRESAWAASSSLSRDFVQWIDGQEHRHGGPGGSRPRRSTGVCHGGRRCRSVVGRAGFLRQHTTSRRRIACSGDTSERSHKQGWFGLEIAGGVQGHRAPDQSPRNRSPDRVTATSRRPHVGAARISLVLRVAETRRKILSRRDQVSGIVGPGACAAPVFRSQARARESVASVSDR